MQVDAHRDLGLLHDTRAVFLAVLRTAPPALDDVHVVEKQVDERLVEIADAGITHRGEDAPEVRIAGEERGLHERRVGNGVGRQTALRLVVPAVDGDGDELRGAFTIPHDRLGQLFGQPDEGRTQRQCLRPIPAG